jgi:hypothetical protein
MRLASAQHDGDGKAYRVAAEMDFGGEATTRAAKCLRLVPPFSPAAQRCARLVVLSIICRASNSPPPSARACRMTSHTPERHQRRNCRQTEFQLPNVSGRSRHGAPVRLIQSTPSSTRRWSAGGRPPVADGVVRNGATIAHSSSVMRPRITANLRNREVGLESYRSASAEAPAGQSQEVESRTGSCDSLCNPGQRVLILFVRDRFRPQARREASGRQTGFVHRA